MEFSKKYLSSYGWEEGQGLGKTRSGIKDAIKPTLKFDKAGLGFDPSQEFTDQWWEKGYKDALKDKQYSSSEDEWLAECKETSLTCRVSKQGKKLESDFNSLFKACKGRTAHKGARHGLQLSGKLQRLEQQEELLLVNKLNKQGDTPVKDTKTNITSALEKSENSEKKRKLKYIQDESKDVLKKRSKKDKTK